MKNKLIGLIVTLFVGSLIMASNATALSIPPEWEEIYPQNTVADGNQFTNDSAAGYYVWTDTDVRLNWHVAMVGGGTSAVTNFSGEINLENADGTYSTCKWESSDSITIGGNGEWATFTAKASTGIDIIDITINNYTSPSYIGFDLNVGGIGDNANMIYIGQSLETVASLGSDDDFKIAAPVPEPATMLLFGTGLLGLVVTRKKLK